MIEVYPAFPQWRRHNHQPQFLVAHQFKKESVKNHFASSNNMVLERVSFPLVINDHPCHPLLRIIRFLFIVEVIEVPLQVSLLSIFLIGLIKILRQTLLSSQILLIDVSQN